MAVESVDGVESREVVSTGVEASGARFDTSARLSIPTERTNAPVTTYGIGPDRGEAYTNWNNSQGFGEKRFSANFTGAASWGDDMRKLWNQGGFFRRTGAVIGTIGGTIVSMIGTAIVRPFKPIFYGWIWKGDIKQLGYGIVAPAVGLWKGFVNVIDGLRGNYAYHQKEKIRAEQSAL